MFVMPPTYLSRFRCAAYATLCAALLLGSSKAARAASPPNGAPADHVVLDPSDYAHYVEKFNAMEDEPVVNLVPNAAAWNWIMKQAPLFDCPSARFEEIYYYRWWSYRKHFKQTPSGVVMTEFILPVSHAGPYNTVSCAFGHHLAEGRWLLDQAWLDDYVRFWFRSGPRGGRASHFHKFSSWAAAAIYDRYLATGDATLPLDLLNDLAADYRAWQSERQQADGLFWQYDVADGMEESISGGRRVKNMRPTINSYMAANARAIASIAELADRRDLANEFQQKFESLREKMLRQLWDHEGKFFKVRYESGDLSDAREAIGFIPWTFNLTEPAHAEVWLQIKDAGGFWAPWGLTTAERRHPKFRTHGAGTCEWDGAVWPFATSQMLTGLANVLRGPPQTHVSRRDYFEQLMTFARAHELDGKPHIGEYLDETTGKWLITGPKAQRSRYYNHSTFNDLVISGLVGLVPSAGDQLEIDPLMPEDAWNWFCLDGVTYHSRRLTIAWDRDGQRYGRGAGFAVWVDGNEAARSPNLARLAIELPAADVNWSTIP
jgi:hypothetical protein